MSRWLLVLFVVGACGGGEGAPDGGGPATSTLEQSVSLNTSGAVLTQHGNNLRTGLDPNEANLTWAKVPGAFGKVFSVPLDGKVYAQPLFVPQVPTQLFGLHDLVFVATEHNSIYALDAHSGAQIWMRNFGPTMPSDDVYNDDCRNIPVEIGITGTPVIDPVHGTILFVNMTKSSTGAYSQWLRSLDVTNGNDAHAAVQITAAVIGDGIAAQFGSLINFDPMRENQRAGLLYDGVTNRVTIAWASHCSDVIDWDVGGAAGPGLKGIYQGWLMAYDATSLQQLSVWNSATHEDTSSGDLIAYGSGIWMGGGGPAFDGTYLYVNTGNGLYTPMQDYGDSVVALDTGLHVHDSFTPSNQADLYLHDLDVSSSGPVLIPDSSPAHATLLVSADKQGTLFVLDRAHLGGAQTPNAFGHDRICAPNTSTWDCVVAEDLKALGYHDPSDENYVSYYGQPAYFNGSIYAAGRQDVLKRYSVGGTTGLSATATMHTTTSFGYPSATPSITASNGSTADGIVWAIQRTSPDPTGNNLDPGHLHAFNADTLAEIWTSTTNSQDPSGPNQFVAPTTAVNQVFLADGNALTVYGLRVQLSPAATTVPQGSTVPLALSSYATVPATSYTLTGAVSPTGPTLSFSPATISSGTGANVSLVVGAATLPGMYTVTVTATSGTQHYTASSVITVTRRDLPPTAVFSATCTVRTCTFDGTASSDDVGIASYSWQFGDGTTATGPTLSTTSHAYATNGPYTATLTVKDSANQPGTATQSVSPIDHPPVAGFTWSCIQRSCSFFSSSTDDAGIASYAWTFGDTGTGTGATPTHSYAALSGSYTVTLTVTDSIGQQTSINHLVTAIDQPPVSFFTASCNQLSCAVDGTGSYDDALIASWRWHWGDGSSTRLLTTNEATHVFGAPGTYVISLDVIDNSGQMGTSQHTVTLVIGPTAAFTFTCTGRTCAFDASGSTGSIDSYHWDWGDETTSDPATPTTSHTFSYGATFDVELIVTDANGQQSPIHHAVTVP
ncbi:MAG TPA: PKD domain-containing protein [Kofleriaceae bacterium]|jgi:PKD repeat protein